MTNRKAIKMLKSFVLNRIENYNDKMIPKDENIDFETIEHLEQQYYMIYGLVFALDMIDSKYHYDVATDMEYSQLIWLHWDKKEEEKCLKKIMRRKVKR